MFVNESSPPPQKYCDSYNDFIMNYHIYLGKMLTIAERNIASKITFLFQSDICDNYQTIFFFPDEITDLEIFSIVTDSSVFIFTSLQIYGDAKFIFQKFLIIIHAKNSSSIYFTLFLNNRMSQNRPTVFFPK